MFDAYTLKKMVPRLVIAAILIQLSWPLFTGLVYLTGQIAWGIEGLLYAPFGGREALNVGVLVGQAANGGVDVTISGVFALTAVSAGALALGPAGLISLGITVLLALLIAFFVLAVRQTVLVILLVISPLALVAWILPGTEKFWKLWWESFSKLLLMYPMILLLIAGGRIAAKIAADASASQSTNDQFGIAIVVLVFFAPFFLIPKTFQLAGSMFANIAGIANNSSRGAFDRLKNFRGQQLSQRHQDRMTGKMGVLGNRGGGAYQRVMSGGRNGAWGVTKNSRSRYSEAQKHNAAQFADKTLEEGGAWAFNNDSASYAALRANNDDEFIKYYKEADPEATDESARDALNRVRASTGMRIGTDAMKLSAGKFRVAHTNTAYAAGAAGLEQMQTEMKMLRDQGLTTEFDQAGWMKSNRGRSDYGSASYQDTVNFLKRSGGTSAHEFLGQSTEGADPREMTGVHQKALESHLEGAQYNYNKAIEAHGVNSSEAQAAAATMEKIKQQMIWHSQKKSTTVTAALDETRRLQGPAIGGGVIDQDGGGDTFREGVRIHAPATGTDPNTGETVIIRPAGDTYTDSTGGRTPGGLDPSDPNHPNYREPEG